MGRVRLSQALVVVAALGSCLLVGPARAYAQAQTVQDSTAAQADTLGAVGDSLRAQGDSVVVFVPRNLISRPRPVPADWSTGVWEWDREGLSSNRALTLLELLEEIPGVIALRGGDYGQPSAAVAFGGGAGDVRIFFDGAEMPPLDGGVVDLSRIGLSDIDRVRVERRPGQLRVELFPLRFEDPRPLSYLEVGTGDFSTNIFRGLFAHPNALGGTVEIALDRLDTAGPQGNEPGVSVGLDARYAAYPMEGLGVAFEMRRMSSRRPAELWQPEDVGRTDWGLRARYEWAPWLTGGVFLQRSSLSLGSSESAQTSPDSLINEESRTQLGAHVAVERGPLWGEAEYREQWGPGWASAVQTVRGGGSLEALGGASFSVERQDWTGGHTALMVHGRAWSRPLYGFSVFGEVQDGNLGVPFWVPPPTPADSIGDGGEEEPAPEEPPSFVERTGIRGGIEYRRGDLFLGVAAFSVEADTLHPLGLPTDRGGVRLPAGQRTGVEVSGEVPLPWLLNGLELRGSGQFWSQGQAWRYLPERSYDARLSFHGVYYDSQNLEVWADVGVHGRDPMSIPRYMTGSSDALQEVPFQQSWSARLQIRVASARLFVLWDNFTLRPKNQDYPGRILPQTRALYGIRWTLWN